LGSPVREKNGDQKRENFVLADHRADELIRTPTRPPPVVLDGNLMILAFLNLTAIAANACAAATSNM
jgi:hypothetical protein